MKLSNQQFKIFSFNGFGKPDDDAAVDLTVPPVYSENPKESFNGYLPLLNIKFLEFDPDYRAQKKYLQEKQEKPKEQNDNKIAGKKQKRKIIIED